MRIASDQDIFDGQCSACGVANSGKFKSIAKVERSGTRLLDSPERIFTTVTQNQGTERFLIGLERAEANNLADNAMIAFSIEIRLDVPREKDRPGGLLFEIEPPEGKSKSHRKIPNAICFLSVDCG